ncbi:hypothetical protein AGLY_005897 [Aphis glycines]|uniref:Uncharacterized protein n=1 Tax=Aphis glycines TaxID=307491 RepID=A0A6G0TSA5_APHGL|nr:hypothetical protein AGLY_005897 [Aphis glycines]
MSKFINASVLMTSPIPGKLCNNGYNISFVTIIHLEGLPIREQEHELCQQCIALFWKIGTSKLMLPSGNTSTMTTTSVPPSLNSHLKSAKKDPCLAGTFFLHSRHTQLNLSTTRARCHCIFSVVRHSLFGHFCSLAISPFFLSHSHRSPSRPAASSGSTVVSKKFGSLQTPGMMDGTTRLYNNLSTLTRVRLP